MGRCMKKVESHCLRKASICLVLFKIQTGKFAPKILSQALMITITTTSGNALRHRNVKPKRVRISFLMNQASLEDSNLSLILPF